MSASARRAAAAWLLERQFDGGGWGYNDSVGADADSTAHALLFLSGQPMALPRPGVARLLSFQQADGGFSTYLADEGLGAWCTSHPDVTGVAARAVLAIVRRAESDPGAAAFGTDLSVALDRALAYMEHQRTRHGTWDSFWWQSFLYSTAAALSLLRLTRTEFDAAVTCRALSALDPANAFERALLLRCHLEVCASSGSSRVASLVKDLKSEQLGDGSWPSAPILRLTGRDHAAPAHRTGPLFADPRRLFTSATVFAALSLCINR